MARLSLAEEIRQTLRERILRGELAQGERVVEQAIAHDMGTSQGPVREAFAGLCQEGLLITLPHRGTFVSTVSEDEARMAYEVRRVLEPMAVALALPKVDDAFLARLEDALDQMTRAAAAGDLAAFSAADADFHTCFYEQAGTQLLQRVWRPVAVTVRKFATVAAPEYVDNLGEAAASHRLLIDLVRDGAEEPLVAAIQKHLGDIWDRIDRAGA